MANDLVDRYLRELDGDLRGLPRARRQELVGEIREHIRDALGGRTDEGSVTDVLAHLGSPSHIASEAYGGSDVRLEDRPTVPSDRTVTTAARDTGLLPRFVKRWVIPTGLAALLMIAGHLVASMLTGVGGNGGVLDFHQWRLLVKWGADPVKLNIHAIPSPAMRAWAIVVQLAAAAVGAIAAWPILRRHPRPVLLGAVAGLVAVLVHVGASRLLTLRPFEPAMFATFERSPDGVQYTPVRHLTLGLAAWDIAGVLALWSQVAFGALLGAWIVHRRDRDRPQA